MDSTRILFKINPNHKGLCISTFFPVQIKKCATLEKRTQTKLRQENQNSVGNLEIVGKKAVSFILKLKKKVQILNKDAQTNIIVLNSLRKIKFYKKTINPKFIIPLHWRKGTSLTFYLLFRVTTWLVWAQKLVRAQKLVPFHVKNH